MEKVNCKTMYVIDNVQEYQLPQYPGVYMTRVMDRYAMEQIMKAVGHQKGVEITSADQTKILYLWKAQMEVLGVEFANPISRFWMGTGFSHILGIHLYSDKLQELEIKYWSKVALSLYNAASKAASGPGDDAFFDYFPAYAGTVAQVAQMLGRSEDYKKLVSEIYADFPEFLREEVNINFQ